MKVMWWSNKRIEELGVNEKRRYKNGIIRGVCIRNLKNGKIGIFINMKILTNYNHPLFEEFDILLHEFLHVLNFLENELVDYLIDESYSIYDRLRWGAWKRNIK